jgi:hypothetical protein
MSPAQPFFFVFLKFVACLPQAGTSLDLLAHFARS